MQSVRRAIPDPSDSLVNILSRIPERAMTAELLGTERSGHGVRVREDGLIATVGYMVLEAEQIWVKSADGQGASAYIVAQDHDSGITLLKPTLPLQGSHLDLAASTNLAVDEPLSVYRSNHEEAFSCSLFARQEFAGRWEYLLDYALFTSPGCNDWAGAALVNRQGQLCGIGSLLMELHHDDDEELLGNMFIPIDMVSPHLDEMCEFGQRRVPPKPWMGAMIQEYEGKLVVTGVYPKCPADLAGIKPGDVVLSVDDEPVYNLSGIFRKVWSLGSAGVEVPLLVSSAGDLRQCRLKSSDRSIFYRSVAAAAQVN